MASVLIVHASQEGQTIRIAEHLARVLAQRGHDARIAPATPFPGLAGSAGIVIAASIHMGRHPHGLVRAVRAHRAVLLQLPSAFLSVSLSAAVGDDAHRRLADGYLREFLASTRWRPDLAATAAGALRFSRYGPFKRRFMQRLARREGLPGHETEFTDWDEVRAFGEAFAAIVTERDGLRFGGPWPAARRAPVPASGPRTREGGRLLS